MSPDGSKVAYSVFPDSIYMIPTSGGEATLLVPPQGKSGAQIYGWTPDGRKIVYWFGSPTRSVLLDPETRRPTDLIASPKQEYSWSGIVSGSTLGCV